MSELANLLRQCEGYCGGMMRLSETRTTQDGEQFCEDCYSKLQEMRQ